MSERLKIKYVMNLRLPTERAHGIQVMKTCEALADLGHEIELVIPKREASLKEDPFEYYKVKKNFKIRRLGYLDVMKLDKFGFFVTTFMFASSVILNISRKDNIFYTRDKSIGFLLRATGRRVVWEDHMGHTSIISRLLVLFKVPIVVISLGLKSVYTKLGAESESVSVAPDAVDIEQFDIPDSKSQARKKLGFKENDKLVVYTGHLYEWKGANTLAEATPLLKNRAKVVFVGGVGNDLMNFKQKYGEMESISILGRKPHNEIPLYMRSADVLVISNSAKEDISKFYTSPMKLFEYMASGTPIVAANLPSLREIVDEEEVYFFTPDDPESLAKAILHVLDNEDEAKVRSSRALEKVKEYSWEKRAKKIIGFINKL